MSAIKELLGKEAHELTDEELADLLRGNRPRSIEAKASKKPKNAALDFDLDDIDFSDLEGNGDLLSSLDLEDAEGRS